MKCAEVMKQLKSLGSAQTRKVYRNHGTLGELYGVKYGDLGKLVRKIKVDHEQALELWETEVVDARVLATMIADPAKMTMTVLNGWMKSVDSSALSNAVSNVAQRSPSAVKLVAKWKARKSARSEWVSSTAWMMVAGITRESPQLYSKKEYKELLKEIENEIHSAPNQTRHAMNSAVIGIGTYIDERSAVAAAKRIGVVEVDHGATSCKTPSAERYIRKAAEKYRQKLAKAAAKAKS